MTKIKMYISKAKLPFYPPCEVKYGLQNGVSIGEESEQFYFLCKLSLLDSNCVEPDSHLFLNINLILPCSCPRAEPIVVVLYLLLQILLVWAMFEKHNPLF